uniref:SAM domain-containing protein n=1 Tax=Tetranychus urticae TaxID=32264 RepID=T1JPQ8_TETUR
MRRKGTLRWSVAKKVSIPVPPPEVVDVNQTRATVQRRSNNLKPNVDRNSLSSTGSSSNSEEGSIILSLLPPSIGSLDEGSLLENWLTSLQFEEYIPLFVSAGYDMPTISRMTPADLTAIGITKPLHRQKLKAGIAKLNIPDGIPNFIPKSLLEWLKLIHLEEYFDILCQQGYDSIDRVIQLTWEDLEEIGIKKLGHQKKLELAIKRVQDLNNGVRRSSTHYSNLSASVPSSSSLSSESSSSSCPDALHSSSHNLSLPLKIFPPLSQEVAINTSIGPKITSPAIESPLTPELKTFQQLSTNDPYGSLGSNSSSQVQLNKDQSSICNSSTSIGFDPSKGISSTSLPPPPQLASTNTNPVTSVRGRSFESLNKDEIDSSKISAYLSSDASSLGSPRRPSFQGYENDCEPGNNRQGLLQIHDFESTATLNRSKGLIKNKPVAKIVAKSRQEDDYQSAADYKKPDVVPRVEVKALGKVSIPSVTGVSGNYSADGYMSDSGSYQYQHYPYQLYHQHQFEQPQYQFQQQSYETDESHIKNLNYQTPVTSENISTAAIYATLKKNKQPPAPPKRTNSMKSGSSNYIYSGINYNQSHDNRQTMSTRCNSLEAIQEQAFATCIKSLTTRFNNSNNNAPEIPPLPIRNHSVTPKPPPIPDHASSPITDDSLPPPPSPLPFDGSDVSSANSSYINQNGHNFEQQSQQLQQLQQKQLHQLQLQQQPQLQPQPQPQMNSGSVSSPDSITSPTSPINSGSSSDKEAMSSSSSTESMPFANDNIGTIKQRTINDSNSTNQVNNTSKPVLQSLPSTTTTSPKATSPTTVSTAIITTTTATVNVAISSVAPTDKSLIPPFVIHTSPTHSGNCKKAELKTINPSAPDPKVNNTSNHLIEDIETMLSNLSNQLDALLESETKIK